MKFLSGTIGILGLSVLALSICFAEDDKAAKADLAALQGHWAMVSGTADGMALSESMVSQAKRVCEGDVVTVTMGTQLIMKARITVDPTKTPKSIDFQVTDGPTKGQKQLGIYELNGDSFKSCFGAPGAERPKEFVSKPGDKQTSTLWKREKQ
jgi:uncharacterized protein (TIGR03067 family)